MHVDDDVLWCSRLPHQVTWIKIQMSAKVARYRVKHFSHLIRVDFCTAHENLHAARRVEKTLERRFSTSKSCTSWTFNSRKICDECRQKCSTRVCWQKSRTQFAQFQWRTNHKSTIESGKIHKFHPAMMFDYFSVNTFDDGKQTNSMLFDFHPIFAIVFDVSYLILN